MPSCAITYCDQSCKNFLLSLFREEIPHSFGFFGCPHQTLDLGLTYCRFNLPCDHLGLVLIELEHRMVLLLIHPSVDEALAMTLAQIQ